MKIPKSFKLAGHTIKVVRNRRHLEIENCAGMTGYQYNELYIQPDSDSYHPDQLESTFFHELTHWILRVCGDDDLRNNESFVYRFSEVLYQAFKTAKY